ncbi:MAG TPA: HAD-IIIA family hydrolase [Prosthecochloris aestuarii]|uniref:HAD-IIIA family hydrolase n=1 Tax=Prosthecochloris aestuarii TaxID=1102 RepID=A0A831SMW0_PROAE|nr:HAD-IIIA family hydrolase [Prosthecochloris aestuarii]
MGLLSEQMLMERIQALKLVLSDNDGVFTDNGVYYSERGEEMKRYSIRDGMGVERLRAVGIDTGIMTGEVSPNLKKRAEKLGIELLYLGVQDKLAKLEDVLFETGWERYQIAYIGDDVNDLAVMEAVMQDGITACPGDATEFVRPVSHYVCSAPGGNGAFREFAEWLISKKEEYGKR